MFKNMERFSQTRKAQAQPKGPSPLMLANERITELQAENADLRNQIFKIAQSPVNTEDEEKPAKKAAKKSKNKAAE